MEDLCTGSGLDPLWDWNLTWYTSRPDLSQCFQKTVLVWSPCIYLWTCSPLYLVYLQIRPTRGVVPLSRLCCSKTLLGLGLASFGLLEMFYLLVKNQKIQNHLLVLMGPLVRSFTLVLAVTIMWVERMKGTRSSVLLFLFWTLLVLCSVVPLKAEVQQIINQGFSDDALRSAAIFICFSLQVVQLILSCFCDVQPHGNQATSNQNQCPEEDASFLSKFFFFWFSSLVIRGYRRPLLAEDLWTLRDQDSSSRIMTDLENFWTLKSKELQTRSRTGSRTLTEKTSLMPQIPQDPGYHFLVLSTLGRSFGLYFLSGTLCLLLHDAVVFAIPQVLSLLLSFMQEVDAPQWKGFLFAVLLFLLSCLQSLLHHHYMLHCFTVGMRAKTAVMGLVYRKSLLMSSTARQQCTLGEIINLVSADTQKLMDFVVYFNSTWIAPIEIAVCFYFLWQLLGPPALAGLSAVLLIFPLNGFIAKLRSKLQEVQMKFTDGRIKLMNEILGGVKILKFYSWEEAFLLRVNELRDGELGALKISQILYSVSLASFNSSSFLIALSVFGVYVLIDERNVLNAEKIFVSVALINILKTPLSQLPFAMSTTMQAFVSLKRLGHFLSQDEVKMENVERRAHRPEGNSVVIEGGVFSWSNHGAACLQNVNITLKAGSLVVVVGHVGSGKSSLLSAMLGETERRSGSVRLEGSVAYVPQQAWIQNASLRDNILFGQDRNQNQTWNQTWYHRVLDACALLPDLNLLPAGDGTEIGERGLNLSGGQKQRVSLARAVYRKSDLYLLDDPLSALDAHVGQQVFNRVLGPAGLLRDKTRVLVTHGLSFLSMADLILVLDHGHVCEMGSYMDLIDRKGVFSRFIQTFSGPPSRETFTSPGPGPSGPRDKGRKSLSRLSVTDFSIDLSQEQLISSTSVQVMEVMEVMEEEIEGGADDAGKLTEADRAQTGRVSLQTYTQYFRTVGLTFIMTVVFLGAFQQAASLAYSYWLSLWADEAALHHQVVLYATMPPLHHQVALYATVPLNATQSDHQLRLSVFAALGLTQGLALFGTTLAIALGGIVASRRLHTDLLLSVLRSPMTFFEATPSGNLLNRFSREVDAIDCMIPDGLKMMLGYLFKLLEVLVIVLLATPLSGLVLLPLACVYVFIQSFYVASSCQLRRLEAVSRSPIYSHFNETVQGAAIIRAFSEQQRFILQNDRGVDTNQKAYFPRFVATRWLAVNLEFLGNLLVLAAAMFSVRSRGELSPGVVGLVVTHSLQVTGILSWIVRSWTDVENNIVSVERVKEYDNTPKEAAWTTNGSLSTGWPNSGTIKFEDYGLQYRRGLDWALKDICVDIQDQEKVGIVGRTGAGKSSLALGLFRIVEPANGRILIDGTDITQIGLHDLRSRITIIPQDPVLFSGSLRMNLDPFETHTDEDLWRALDLAHMSSFVSGLLGDLDYECCEGGENFSLGQRQLLCLARALLRKSRILVLDEATAAVDLNLDQLIQSTIRTQFKDCTVLTIAHRLNTIMDYTRVVVMERGSVVEMDSPTQLLRLQGLFYQMCVEAGVV